MGGVRARPGHMQPCSTLQQLMAELLHASSTRPEAAHMGRAQLLQPSMPPHGPAHPDAPQGPVRPLCIGTPPRVHVLVRLPRIGTPHRVLIGSIAYWYAPRRIDTHPAYWYILCVLIRPPPYWYIPRVLVHPLRISTLTRIGTLPPVLVHRCVSIRGGSVLIRRRIDTPHPVSIRLRVSIRLGAYWYAQGY